MRLLRLLHLYSGLALTLLLLVLAVSGGVLIYKEEIWRLRYPALAEPPAALTAADHAAAFQRIAATFAGERIRLIKLPRPGVAAYHVYLEREEAFVSQRDHRLIARWHWYQDPVGLLTELHIHLGAGPAGRTAVGIVGVALALMAVSGLVLWWPLRRRFGFGSLWPRQLGRLPLLRLHRDLGVLAGPLIVLFALTGAGVVFYGTAQLLLNGLLSDRPAETPRPQRAAAMPVGIAGAAVIEVAQAALPQARLMSYTPPATGSAVHYFRLRRPGEVHPNGRSVAFVDGNDATLLAAADATTQPRGERAAHWLYPLHSARVGGELYRLLALITALALTVMSLSGPLSWLQSRRRRGVTTAVAVAATGRPLGDSGRASR